MSPDLIQNSVCPGCYHCEYDRKQIGCATVIDCRCEYDYHTFGKVKAAGDCQGFFQHATLLETSGGRACLLAIGV